ncbi:MAG: flagellar basal body rod C-terminal domain-containing protein [Nautiliaceae bacterium]
MMINNINSLQAYQTLIDVNANNIANVNTEDFNSTDARIVDKLDISSYQEEGVNITKELTNQIVIEDGFKAQLPAIKTQEEMDKTILDIKA